MDEQSKAALELLVQNGYLEIVKGKYRCTAKLNSCKLSDEVISRVVITDDWEGLYTKYIIEAKVPKRGEFSDGTEYDLNKYNQDAMKQFKQMLSKEGIDYELLVKVTQSYYKSPGRYKKTISNFILEGIWRMDYLVLKDQTPEQQQQTLQKQINESTTFTRDRIG